MDSEQEQIQGLREAAHKIIREDSSIFKIVIVEHGRAAGILNNLLTRGMGVSKKRVTELGCMATDFQNLANLAQQRDIVIAPLEIVANRPCVFLPPEGVRQVVVFTITGNQVRIERYQNEGQPFELKIRF